MNISTNTDLNYIKYQNCKKQIHTEKYDNDTLEIQISKRDVVKIIEIQGLQKLQVLDLSYNKLTDIAQTVGLEKLSELRVLKLSFNRITNIGEIIGLNKLTKLTELNFSNNEISQISNLDTLLSLKILSLDWNQIKEITRLDKLTQLRQLYLIGNQITSINGLDKLVNLQILHLSNNQIIRIEGLETLTNLTKLELSGNKISVLEGFETLTNLQTINILQNNITRIPSTVINLHNLVKLYYDTHKIQITEQIRRFLNRSKLNAHELHIYNDNQNVHDSKINKSISQSIEKILNNSVPFEILMKDILEDNILDQLTKDSLIEYSSMLDIHSTLNVTFKQVLCSVWYIIKNHKECDQIKQILNEEMKDSLCKCFTGRLSRLVNCLNGFDDQISIKISDNDDIANIIILIRNKYSDIDSQKKEIVKELNERGYNDDTINEWISYL